MDKFQSHESVPANAMEIAPADWTEHPPLYGVILGQDKRVFVLKNRTANWVRCEVSRSRQGHATVERYMFVVGPHEDSHQVVWLEGTDTGKIELTDVETCPVDGPLNGSSRVKVKSIPGEEGVTPKVVVNDWSVPIYYAVDFQRGRIPDITARGIVPPHSATHTIYADIEPPTVVWRAAELQRTSLYGLWPPPA